MDAAGQDRHPGDLGRVVALVGDADQLVAQPEREHDLGGGREEGDDTHRTSLRVAAGTSHAGRAIAGGHANGPAPGGAVGP